jgi:hypothetical protein
MASSTKSVIPVKAFDLQIDTSLGGSSFYIVGTSKAGKTTLMKYIRKTYYKDNIPLMFSQNKHADIIKDCHTINSKFNNKFPFLIITDDIVGNNIKNDPEITRLSTIYRNANMSCIQSLQDLTLMSAVGRNNTNFIAIFKQSTPKKLEAVVKEFLSTYFPTDWTMREMVAYVKQALEPKGQFFMINNLTNECYLTKLSSKQI